MAMRGWKDVTAADIARMQNRGAIQQPAKRSKYRNLKLQTPDGEFDSKKEYQQWLYLRSRQSAGEIRDLTRQKDFPLFVGEHLICTYYCDFAYNEIQRDGSWRSVVADAKSAITKRNPVYSIKKKLMKALYSVDILEI